MSIATWAGSSVGKKWITGISGVILVLFLVGHLVGNLTLFMGADAFNGYAYFLEHLAHGKFLIAFELVMSLVVLGHIVYGIQVRNSKKSARKVDYYKQADAGGRSRKTFASLNMLVTGVVLLVFIVLHIKHFKFGDASIVVVDGKEMRDIYTLVINAFQDLPFVLFYVLSMAFLGMHLMHGVWSALQSLGATRPDLQDALYWGGRVFGALLAFGFLLLPVIVYLFYEPIV